MAAFPDQNGTFPDRVSGRFQDRLASTRNLSVAEIFASTRANLVNRIGCFRWIGYFNDVELCRRVSDGWINMNVVIDTSDLDRGHTVIFCDAGNVRPHTLLNIRRDHLAAILRAEYEMQIYLGICVSHVFDRRYATEIFYPHLPWVKTPRLQSNIANAMKTKEHFPFFLAA